MAYWHMNAPFLSQELLDTIDWPDYISSQAKSVILGLLAGRETERLGGNAGNLLAVSDFGSLYLIIFSVLSSCANQAEQVHVFRAPW